MNAKARAAKGADAFAFTRDNAKKAKAIVARYPPGRQASAVLPLLDLAQRQNEGWLSRAAMDYVAGLLEMPLIRVYEVGTFYSMLRLEPVGEHLVEVCTNTPCWLCGSDEVLEACRKTLGIGLGETSDDGRFTLEEVECLGACVNAPIMAVDGAYYEDLNAESAERVLEAVKRGKTPKAGSQIGRVSSEPVTGLTTLKEPGGG